MSKVKTSFVCNECGVDHVQWQGQCNACGTWNSLREMRLPARAARTDRIGAAGPRVATLCDLEAKPAVRISTGIGELNRVLGGGLVPGSAVLLGGDPGAGKSTLLLQVSAHVSTQRQVLYITGEESLDQLAMRARRLHLEDRKLSICSETAVESIIRVAESQTPDLLVIDSVQTVHTQVTGSAPGTVAQVRESAALLVQFAKRTGASLILIGHVNKEGNLAGPKVLEHMIDCFIMLESGADPRFRNLRGLKNRFGAVGELGMFAMLEDGLREIANPSAIFLNQNADPAAGSVVTVFWEGSRPILVEVQALVDSCQGGYARRVTVGFEQNRLILQLAVLHKHGGLIMADQDVFLNVVGGLKVTETASDLAVLLAILSSLRFRPLPRDLIAFGEVGLSGEIRPVSHGQERLREAQRHGFRQALIPEGNRPKGDHGAFGELAIHPVRRLTEALEWAGAIF